MKVSDYVPKLYENCIEMNSIISSEEIEFENKLKPNLQKVFADNFAKIATETGIAKFEKLLNIQLDSNSDNLEYRRARVLAKLSATAPLTYRWLEDNLRNLVGENNYYIDLHPDEYSISISVSNVYLDVAELLYDVYRPLIPANLTLKIGIFETELTNLYIGAIIHEGEHSTIAVSNE